MNRTGAGQPRSFEDSVRFGPAVFVWDSGVNSLRHLKAAMRHPLALLPAALLLLSQCALSLLKLHAPSSGVVRLLSLLTFAQGGMYGGFWGALGGVIGKMLLAVFVTRIKSAVSGRKPPQRKKLPSGSAGFWTCGIGMGLMAYNFLTGNARLENAMIGVICAISLFKTADKPEAFLTGLFRSFRRGKITSASARSVVLGLGTGMVLGVLSSLRGGGILCYVGGATVLLFGLLMCISSKRRRAGAAAAVFVICLMAFTAETKAAQPLTAEEVCGDYRGTGIATYSEVSDVTSYYEEFDYPLLEVRFDDRLLQPAIYDFLEMPITEEEWYNPNYDYLELCGYNDDGSVRGTVTDMAYWVFYEDMGTAVLDYTDYDTGTHYEGKAIFSRSADGMQVDYHVNIVEGSLEGECDRQITTTADFTSTSFEPSYVQDASASPESEQEGTGSSEYASEEDCCGEGEYQTQADEIAAALLDGGNWFGFDAFDRHSNPADTVKTDAAALTLGLLAALAGTGGTAGAASGLPAGAFTNEAEQAESAADEAEYQRQLSEYNRQMKTAERYVREDEYGNIVWRDPASGQEHTYMKHEDGSYGEGLTADDINQETLHILRNMDYYRKNSEGLDRQMAEYNARSAQYAENCGAYYEELAEDDRRAELAEAAARKAEARAREIQATLDSRREWISIMHGMGRNTTKFQVRAMLNRETRLGREDVRTATAEAKKWEQCESAAGIVSTGADIAMDALENWTGPTGKALNSGYKVLKGAAGKTAEAYAKGEDMATAAWVGGIGGGFEAGAGYASGLNAAAVTMTGGTVTGALEAYAKGKDVLAGAKSGFYKGGGKAAASYVIDSGTDALKNFARSKNIQFVNRARTETGARFIAAMGRGEEAVADFASSAAGNLSNGAIEQYVDGMKAKAESLEQQKERLVQQERYEAARRRLMARRKNYKRSKAK